MKTVSVCLIVKNEESCLDKCLTSVKGADEIVVLDTGSEDKTCEIARKYTDKVFENEYKWNDSFCEARNYALAKCTGDWVLTIDADEVFESTFEQVKKAIDIAEQNNHKTVNCRTISASNGDEHFFPRLYKRCPEVFWKGAIHNYLSVSENNQSNIAIRYGYSAAHAKDPDRSLRILKKEVNRDPNCRREKFYLAREYWYRKDYITALYWYNQYLKVGYWAPETSEANLMKARCLWQLQRGEEARDTCLQAIKINADFKEALLFMAEMTGPKNRLKWTEYAKHANNENVLFVRNAKTDDTAPKIAAAEKVDGAIKVETVEKVAEATDVVTEKGPEYYDNLFSISSDMSRYEATLQEVGNIVKGKKILDVGCGTGELAKYVDNYAGFDFSSKAVEIANNPNVWKGDVYEKDNFDGNYDVYVCLEVLEHVEDLKVLENIPKGKEVVFSVPSFPDPSHIRTYTEESLRERFDSLVDIRSITRFNWTGKWSKGGEETESYILLVRGITR